MSMVSNSDSLNSSRTANVSTSGSIDTVALAKFAFVVAPYVGWAGVVFLPFFFASGKSFASVAVWQYIVAAVLGVGIAIGTRFIPFPDKFKWLRKLLLWLPIIVVAIVVAISLIAK